MSLHEPIPQLIDSLQASLLQLEQLLRAGSVHAPDAGRVQGAVATRLATLTQHAQQGLDKTQIN